MNTFLYLELNLVGLIIITILLTKQKMNVELADRSYRNMTWALIGILLLDSGMWLIDGKQFMFARELNQIISSLYFCFNCLVPFCWFWYLSAFFQEKKLQKYKGWMVVPLVCNIIVVLLDIKFQRTFQITEENYYVRGDFFYLYVIFTFLYILAAAILCIKQYMGTDQERRKNESRLMLALTVYVFAMGIFQVMWFGLSLIWISVVISMLLIFVNFQSRRIGTDALTSLHNRYQLDRYFPMLSGGTYCMMMLDVDRFKEINDTYNHVSGDQALIAVAEVLKKACQKTNAFLCRYGGDEFLIICKSPMCETIARRIRTYLEEFNQNSKYPFDLSVSMGWVPFSPEEDMDRVIARADDEMYLHKKRSQDNKD